MGKFKAGDKVEASPMWKYKHAIGSVIKVTSQYVVVRWDGINGDWHYTPTQAEKLKVLGES